MWLIWPWALPNVMFFPDESQRAPKTAGPAFDSFPSSLQPHLLEFLLSLNLWFLLAFYLKDKYVHCALGEMAHMWLSGSTGDLRR